MNRKSEDENYTKMSNKALIARIRDLEAMATSPLTCKVSNKGAVSVYGLGRYPVTLYVGQWERLFDHVEQIKAFITACGDKLSRKPQNLVRTQEPA